MVSLRTNRFRSETIQTPLIIGVAILFAFQLAAVHFGIDWFVRLATVATAGLGTMYFLYCEPNPDDVPLSIPAVFGSVFFATGLLELSAHAGIMPLAADAAYPPLLVAGFLLSSWFYGGTRAGSLPNWFRHDDGDDSGDDEPQD